jgi:diguanylate cyclase (GGDEF)-like protein/PAS domain S-box-containing protein
MRSLTHAGTLGEFVRNLHEGVYITSASGDILDANPAFLQMFGAASLADIQIRTAASLLVNPERRAEEVRLLQQDGAVREFELDIVLLDGTVRTVLDTAYQVVDPSNGEVLYHGILIDITDRKDLERRLQEMVIRDPLTGCFNRRFLQGKAQVLEARDDTWGCLVVDIDHFKAYNDTYGHDMGDRLLVQTGRFLLNSVRVEDFVIRMGGDEFAVLLPGLDPAAAREVANRMRSNASVSAPVSFTLGFASREGRERVEDTLRRADHDLIRVRVAEREPRLRSSHPSDAGAGSG